ncbi:beta-lactamase-like protein 2 homolog [Leptopilina heterotoma]|uniref:beta-lactamase-like protein 2 homolog n=1 Tax=Leptopilina heterotoma TaxID=63436 RepID=UPI001CA81AE0|nr:beta-lactamase-like protein 2 homolog [Leptopilina heterotoma]
MTSLTAIPLISRLSNNVIRILGCNPGPMTLQGTNTYLVGSGSRRILIDTGDVDTAPKYVKLLSQVLDDEGASIEHMLITHWHHDHIGGVPAIQNCLKTKNLKSVTVWKLPRSSTDTAITNGEKFEWNSLNCDQMIEVEGAKLQIKPTPGHTTDHYCLYMEQENILFSGDCILGEGTAVFEDLHDYMISLKDILKLSPSLIYPGHGPVINDPVPRIQYYIQHRQQREDEILKCLQNATEPISVMEIVQIVYKTTPKDLWPAASINVNHHLEKLNKEGKVIGQKNNWLLNKL